MQGSESVEKLGASLQWLAVKALPKTTGSEFDRLLRGRFFQALHTKWQRKLGAPKPGESFNDLYDRARTLERHDKQFLTAAAGKPIERTAHSRSQQSHKTPASEPGPVVTQNSSVDHKSSQDSKDRDYGSRRRQGKRPYCVNCDLVGHHTHDCRSRSKKGAEAKGNSTSAALTAESSLEKFTDQQLEECLASRRKTQETTLMTDAAKEEAKVDTLTADSPVSSAVGPTPHLCVEVEGISVTALVDSGSQSTITS